MGSTSGSRDHCSARRDFIGAGIAGFGRICIWRGMGGEDATGALRMRRIYPRFLSPQVGIRHRCFGIGE